MSLRLRVGRVSVSSRGRVGGSIGPLSGSVGPRRQHRGGGANPVGCMTFVVVFAAIMLTDALHHHHRPPPLTTEQQAHAITENQYEAVRYYEPRVRLIADLGTPEAHAQITRFTRLRSKVHPRCVFYNVDGSSPGDVYRFCFNKHRLLISRGRYYGA